MWFVRVGKQVKGPYTEDQLRSMRQRGEFAPIHQISEDLVKWQSAAHLVKKLDGPIPEWRVRTGTTMTGDLGATSISAGGGAGPAQSNDQWYYMDSTDQRVGPVSLPELQDLLRTGELPGDALVYQVGEPDWAHADDHPALASSIPTARASILAGRGMILAIAGSLIVVGLASALITTLVSRKSIVKKLTDTPHGAQGMVGAGAIRSVYDEASLKKAVGLVVCGWTVSLKDGSVGDDKDGAGTCFAITPDGYLITNKHVVEDAEKRQRMAKDYLLVDYLITNSNLLETAKNAVIAEINKKSISPPRDSEQMDRLTRAVAEKLAEPEIPKLQARVKEIEPKVWVFFGSRSDLYTAKVIHVSERHDMAVLKIKATGMPFLRLANPDDLPRPPNQVFALGFPGTSRLAASKEERSLDSAQEHRSIGSKFRDRDFIFDITEGAVSKIFAEDGSSRQWIQHRAEINPGNSGGPLVTSDGTAVAINTQYFKRERDASATFQSLAIPQLLGEITPLVQEHAGRE